MKSTLLVTALVTCVASSSFALVSPFDGTSVAGTLQFNGGGPNYFDSANGFVPAGYGNASSPTVTIGVGTEFGFADGANTDTANFMGNMLIISDTETSTAGAAPWVMTFTDPTFAGASVGVGADSFSGLTASLTGDTITVSWAGDSGNSQSSYSATINLTAAGTTTNAVPDGGATLGLLGLGLLGLGAMKRKIASR